MSKSILAFGEVRNFLKRTHIFLYHQEKRFSKIPNFFLMIFIFRTLRIPLRCQSLANRPIPPQPGWLPPTRPPLPHSKDSLPFPIRQNEQQYRQQQTDQLIRQWNGIKPNKALKRTRGRKRWTEEKKVSSRMVAEIRMGKATKVVRIPYSCLSIKGKTTNCSYVSIPKMRSSFWVWISKLSFDLLPKMPDQCLTHHWDFEDE